MNIRLLKNSILNKSLNDNLLIFDISVDKNDFIPISYIKEISNFKKLIITYVDNPISNNLFSTNENKFLYVYRCDYLDIIPNLENEKNLIIIADKLSTIAYDTYKDNLVIMPELEKWHIKDYVTSLLDNLDESKIDNFLNNYDYNIYDIDNELKKVTLFDNKSTMYNKFESNNIFDKLNPYVLYDLSNAILKRNVVEIATILKSNLNIEPMQLLGLLINNFKNIINIQLDKNATAESCKMNSKQFNAIKYYNCNHYSRNELISILECLTTIDSKLKKGELDYSLITDYILINILGKKL